MVYVGPDHDLIHTSLVLTGFCALAGRGDVDLRYHRPTGADDWLTGDPVVVCFDIEGPQPLRVAIDLRDGEGISQPIIDRVQWYFKRSFHRPELDRLPPALAAKMRPFGLNYPCRSTASTLRLLAAIGLPLALGGRRSLSRFRPYLSTPSSAAYEQGPDVAVEPRVMFQTRLWTAAEVSPDEMDSINNDRVMMVRALREAFGDRFVGGLLPTRFALERYPNEVTPHTSKVVAYLALKKRCLIQVYTRGLEHSLAFKLGETFAASLCLVSVPLRYELPLPIEEGLHRMTFETLEACIDACRQLLEDPVRARAMRQANHEYYVREVEPAAHIARVLARLE